MDGAFDGYADVADPRERYDDLIVECEVERLDPDAFAAVREMEAFRAGWVAVGAVVDSAGRVLLAYHEADGRWLLPGGALQPGESLREGLTREVREETGVDVTPGRPYAVVEHVVRHEGEQTGFRVCVLAARPEATETGVDLGVDGEPIARAEWFEQLPDDVFERELVARVLARVRDE
ncbi:NUDIX domain-containing protein [Halovivax sp.]|uniref:NUDIX hydrolase n=1 Tax=Halovivax sp. TaxID=1935978 RepID=UPI0025B99A55|nr:NUDIX domain-containing protein [Halovivax sp.]